MSFFQSSIQEEKVNFQVFIRIRPMIKKSRTYEQQSSVIKLNKDQNVLYAVDFEYKNSDKKERAYTFNGILDDRCNNESVF